MKLPVDTYHMNVHLFGKTDSPSCLNWALTQITLDNCEKFNVHVVNPVLNKIHIDDYLKSFDNLDGAFTTIYDITRLLTFSGFNLAKFISNNHIILKNLSHESLLSKVMNLGLEEQPIGS